MLFFNSLPYAVQFFYCMRGRKILLRYSGRVLKGDYCKVLESNLLFYRRDRRHINTKQPDLLLEILTVDVEQTRCLGDISI